MIECKSEDWQQKYREAVEETDQFKLGGKIKAAEFALFLRLQQMHHGIINLGETIALYYAIHALNLLRSAASSNRQS